MTKWYDEKHIGENMQHLRKNVLKLSQEKFGKMVNLSKDTISNIERGRYLPSVANLINISNQTNIPLDFFLRDLQDE